jgi:hypothetical protein
MTRGVGLWLGAVVSLAASSVRAETPSLWTSWRAPGTCPQEAALVAQTEAFLGHPLNQRGDRRLEIVGDVQRDDTRGYVARLRVSTSRGNQERELAHQDCAELTEAAALVVALAIDPDLVVPEKPAAASTAPEAPAPPPPAPAASGPEPPAPAPILPPAPVAYRREPPAAAPQTLHGSLSALGLFGSSLLPGAGLGVGAHATFGVKRFRLAAQGSYWLSRSEPVPNVADGAIDLGAWGVALKACALPIAGDVILSLCFGPAVGDMYGGGNEALEDARVLHEHWSALELEASLSLASSSGVATVLGLELGKTLEAPRFGIVENTKNVEVFVANAWSVNAFIGLGINR